MSVIKASLKYERGLSTPLFLPFGLERLLLLFIGATYLDALAMLELFYAICDFLADFFLLWLLEIVGS